MNIYKKLSLLTTNFFMQKSIIDKDKQQIYEYGFEVLISSVSYIVSLIIISIISNTLIPSAIFFAGFFIIRTISGGYHARTYKLCHLLFFGNHIAFILFIRSIPNPHKELVSIILILISVVIILIFAPVDHPNKPFTPKEKTHFRSISITYAIILLCIAITILLFDINFQVKYSLSFAIGSISAAISLMIAKIKKE